MLLCPLFYTHLEVVLAREQTQPLDKDRKFSFPRVREGTDLEGNSNSDEPEDMLSDSLLCFAYFYTLSFVSFAMLRASHLPTALIILEHFFFST